MPHPTPSYLATFVDAFRDVAKEGPRVHAPPRLRWDELTARVPATKAHAALSELGARTMDVDLGLKAAERCDAKALGILYYLVRTSATVREAIEALCRYSVLVSDLARFSLTLHQSTSIFRIAHSEDLPRAAIDFAMTGLFRHHVRDWPRKKTAEVVIWLPYPRPRSVVSHERAFSGAVVRFGAPVAGFILDAQVLEAPLKSADAVLHEILGRYAELEVARLSVREVTHTTRVREVIAKTLPIPPTVEAVSKELGVGPRTLLRRLRAEGTTFGQAYEDVRRDIALLGVEEPGTSAQELARRCGFTERTTFNRAFRRWTGGTFSEFRQRRRQER